MKKSTSNKMQVERISSLLNDNGKNSLIVLSELQLIQRQQSDSLEKKIRNYKNILVRSIYDKLMSFVEDTEQRYLLNSCISEKGGEENPTALLTFFLRSMTDTAINSYDEFFVLIGSSIANVKEEELVPTFSSFEVCKKTCEEITKLWDGLAEITCHDNSLKEHGLISFGFDASGFILEKEF